MIQSARFDMGGFAPPDITPITQVIGAEFVSPHRLEAQDATLSRLRLEFESPWGHKPPNKRFLYPEPELSLIESLPLVCATIIL